MSRKQQKNLSSFPIVGYFHSRHHRRETKQFIFFTLSVSLRPWLWNSSMLCTYLTCQAGRLVFEWLSKVAGPLWLVVLHFTIYHTSFNLVLIWQCGLGSNNFYLFSTTPQFAIIDYLFSCFLFFPPLCIELVVLLLFSSMSAVVRPLDRIY